MVNGGLNDFPMIIVDVIGVGAGVFDRQAELGLPVAAYNGGEAPFDKERFVNARAEDCWSLREIFEAVRSTSMSSTTSLRLSSDRSSGRCTHGDGSRSSRRKTCGSGEAVAGPCRHRCSSVLSLWICSADQGTESRRRSITGDLMSKAW